MVKNSYEEVRKQRLEENKKRFQELGIGQISKGLSELKTAQKSQPRLSKPKPKTKTPYELEPRRSSRARNPAPSYRDDVGIELPSLRKRLRTSSSGWESYVARPLDEIKIATYEERAQAYKAAEKLQSSLQSGNPSFVKSMVRSHVYSCFWLGLPSRFCEEYLPKTLVGMVLEDENGAECDAVYIGKRAGLSGGWRGFALERKLDDGDALVFELVEPARFKIYIIRASSISSQEHEEDIEKGSSPPTHRAKKKTRGSATNKSGEKNNSAAAAPPQPKKSEKKAAAASKSTAAVSTREEPEPPKTRRSVRNKSL